MFYESSTLENVILAALILAVVLLWSRGIKTRIEESKQTPSDWGSVFKVMSILILFIVLLIFAAQSL